MTAESVPVNSPFAKAVYQLLRPRIPRSYWPAEPIEAVFVPAADGRSLRANFEAFPRSAADLAARLVAEAGLDLMLMSPLAPDAVVALRARRWRDAGFYLILPLLFTIPLAGHFSLAAMREAFLLFILDVAGTVIAHAALTRSLAFLAERRFVAEIPVPDLLIAVAAAEIDSPAHG